MPAQSRYSIPALLAALLLAACRKEVPTPPVPPAEPVPRVAVSSEPRGAADRSP